MAGDKTMTVDERMEQIYQRVELVRGAGDRRHGKLCIMSFVALLAGEGHTDSPCTASAVLRRFAITINDEMPVEMRQRLKPFAPRIIGTRDGNDWARAELLIRAWQTEVLPRLRTDFKAAARPPDRSMAFLLCVDCPPRDMAVCEQVASTVARLISHYAMAAKPRDRQEWYWLKAIDLLDRLCSVGSERPRPALEIGRLEDTGAMLEKNADPKARGAWARAAIMRIRNLVPALLD
jgi:hypothetical protein